MKTASVLMDFLCLEGKKNLVRALGRIGGFKTSLISEIVCRKHLPIIFCISPPLPSFQPVFLYGRFFFITTTTTMIGTPVFIKPEHILHTVVLLLLLLSLLLLLPMHKRKLPVGLPRFMERRERADVRARSSQ